MLYQIDQTESSRVFQFPMDLLEWKNVVADIAIVFTIGVFSAGILTCRKIIQNRSVGVVPYLPFLAACLNCSFWDVYGYLKDDWSLIFINSLGLALQIVYIVVYFKYTENKPPFVRDMVVTGSIIGVVLLCIWMVPDHMTKLNYLGIVTNFFTICFFGSPLSTMADVVRTKSTETMSLPFSALSALTTFSWTLYGVIISDIYVQLPNAVGLLLSLVQLSLFCFYSSNKRVLTIQSPA